MRTEKLSTKKQRRFSYALLAAFYFIVTLAFIRPGVAGDHYQSCRQTKALIFTGDSENSSSAELDAFYENHRINFKIPSKEDLDWLVDFARSHQNHWTVNYFTDAEKLLGEELSKRILTKIKVFSHLRVPYALSVQSNFGSSPLSIATSEEIYEKEVIMEATGSDTEFGGEKKGIISKGRSFLQKIRKFISERGNTANANRAITKANLAVVVVDFGITLYKAFENREEGRNVSRFLATLRDTSCKDLSRHPEAVTALESFREEIIPLFKEVRDEMSRNIT